MRARLHEAMGVGGLREWEDAIDDRADTTVFQGAAEASEETPGEALFPISLLTKAPVVASGEHLGNCIDAMAGSRTGKLDYVVVSLGGIGGVGETLREVPWEDFTVGEDSITLDLGRPDFDGLPPIDPQRWPAHPDYVR